MADVLILGKDDKTCFEVETIAKQQGFRAKLIFEEKAATEWLKLRPFDAILADVTISTDDQQRLADLAWSKNPLSRFIIFDLRGPESSLGNQARLFGAEYVYGQRGVAHLKRLFEKILAQKPVPKSDFNILVVEDLDSPRDIICFYLEGLGYSRVKGVGSAKEAMIELDKQRDYACIITDVRMPEISGKELIEYVRQDERYAKLPIIVLSAIGTLENLIDCMRAGASGFLVKPPKKEDIIRELSRAQRIVSVGEDARLVQPDEVDQFRDIVALRGIA